MPVSHITDAALTTYQVSQILQVSPQIIVRWTDQGILTSFRTPGGHRRIRRQDLLEFVNKHHIPVVPA
jgi:excisionase family DNA binding protein